jgi:hypothetical protein
VLGPKSEEDPDQQHRQPEVELAEQAQAAIEPEEEGGDGHRHDGEGEGRLQSPGHGDAGERIEPGAKLLHAQADGGDHAEDSRHHREGVHDVAGDAEDAPAEQGVQGRAHGQRQLVAKAE